MIPLIPIGTKVRINWSPHFYYNQVGIITAYKEANAGCSDEFIYAEITLDKGKKAACIFADLEIVKPKNIFYLPF